VYFLPKGDRWTVVGGSKAIFSNNRKMQRTIGVDTSVAIAEAERDEKKAIEDLAEAKRREAMLEHEHSTAMIKWNSAKRSCSQNMKEVEELTQQIENARSEIENASSETTFDTSEYEEEVAQTGEKLEDLTKSAQDLQVQLEELESPIREIKAKLDDWVSLPCKSSLLPT
jgi:chromosome segregation ATPase